jgi:hypothetical protein
MYSTKTSYVAEAMQAKLYAALLLVLAALTAAELATNENVLGTWVGDCKWLYARNSQNNFQCVSAEVSTPYVLRIQPTTLSWNTSATTQVIDGETYNWPPMSEVNIAWTLIGNGFLNVTHVAGPACYHIVIEGDKMVEKGQFYTADFSSAPCVDPSKPLYCNAETLNYRCELVKSAATSLIMASAVGLVSLIALLF